MAALAPDTFVGLGPSAIGQLLGKPASTRQDAMSTEWTYTTSDCSLMIFFYPDIATGALRALKYNVVQANGKIAGDGRDCVHLIQSARNDEPG